MEEEDECGRSDILNTSSPSSKGNLNQIFICSEEGCDSRFSKRAYLEQHMCIHTSDRPFVCPNEGCNRSYKRKDHLNRHTKMCPSSQSSEQNQFPCTIEGCEDNFSGRDDVRKHIRDTHSTKKKTFPCLYEGCSQVFKKHKELRAHKFEHTQKNPFECSHPGCEMSFRWMNRLKKHMKVHEGYTCPECGEKFEKWTLLLKHKTSEHQVQHTCSQCQKTFSHRHRLKLHMKIHSEEREVYECPRDGCGRYYSEKRNLDAHIRSYHDGRRFACTHESCDRTFAFKHKMLEHLKSHSIAGKFKSKYPKKGHRKRKVASLLTGVKNVDDSEESLDSDDLLPSTSNETESSLLPSFDWGGSNEIWNIDNCNRLEETNSYAPKEDSDSSGLVQLAEAPVLETIDDTEHSKDSSIHLIEDPDPMQKSDSGDLVAKSYRIPVLGTANQSDSYSSTNAETNSEWDTTESTEINKNYSTPPTSSDNQGHENPQLLHIESDNSGNIDQQVPDCEHVTTDNLLKCVLCSLSFECESLLKEHQKQHITEPQSFSCPRRKCQNVYTTQRKLDLHLQCDHDGLGFPCMYVNCGMVFESQRLLEKHFSIHNVKMRKKKKKKLAKFILENFANC